MDKFDRHLFWPHGTPAPSFDDFQLVPFGDAEWLANAVITLALPLAPRLFVQC